MPKKISRQHAIDQNCKDCIYDPGADGNWKQQVTACTSTNCALYDWRPRSAPYRSEKRRIDPISGTTSDDRRVGGDL